MRYLDSFHLSYVSVVFNILSLTFLAVCCHFRDGRWEKPHHQSTILQLKSYLNSNREKSEENIHTHKPTYIHTVNNLTIVKRERDLNNKILPMKYTAPTETSMAEPTAPVERVSVTFYTCVARYFIQLFRYLFSCLTDQGTDQGT